MIELYQFDYSPYCIKIRAVLNVKNIDYQTVEILPLVTQYKVRRVSGQSKVPVMVDGSTVLTDSTDIAVYLDTAWPEPRLLPEAYDDYRACYLWEDWADEVMVPLIRALAFSAVLEDPALGREQLPPFGSALLDSVLPRAVPLITRAMMHHYGIDADEVKAARRTLGRHMEFLTGAVATSDHLVGEGLTMADIAVASVGYNLDTIPSVRRRPEYQTFFDWRDQILSSCGIA